MLFPEGWIIGAPVQSAVCCKVQTPEPGESLEEKMLVELLVALLHKVSCPVEVTHSSVLVNSKTDLLKLIVWCWYFWALVHKPLNRINANFPTIQFVLIIIN